EIPIYTGSLLALWGLAAKVVGLELRVFRGVGYGMVRDCRELVADLAGKQEKGSTLGLNWCYRGKSLVSCPSLVPEVIRPFAQFILVVFEI
nr:hypothetical protein [Tanacetum cinerariifolium]